MWLRSRAYAKRAAIVLEHIDAEPD